VWLVWRRRWVTGLAALAVIGLLAAVAPAAWGARNAARLDAFVPVSTNGGLNLLLGNSPDATATSGVDVDLTRYQRVIDRRRLDEVEADEYQRDEAIEWMREHPGRASTLYVQKLANFFNFRNELATDGQRSPLVDLLSALTYYPVLIAFVARILACRRYPFRTGELMLVLAFFTYALVSAVFFTRLRFRVPVDQLMAVVAASGVVAWIGRHRGPAEPGPGGASRGEPTAILTPSDGPEDRGAG
jgi:hypothetical protein